MSFNVQTDIDNHKYPVITTPFKSDVDMKSLTTPELPIKNYTYLDVLHINSTLSFCYYKLRQKLSRNVVFQVELENNVHEYNDNDIYDDNDNVIRKYNNTFRSHDSYRRLCIIPDVPLSVELCNEVASILNEEFDREVPSFVLFTPILSDNTTLRQYKDIILMLLCIKTFPEISNIEYDDELFFKGYIKCMKYRDDCLWLEANPSHSSMSYADYARLSIVASMYIDHMACNGYAVFDVNDVSMYNMEKVNTIDMIEDITGQNNEMKEENLMSIKKY